ncbi:hypothetical protein MRB53_022161 [Persea americana]|uniref:Uncharacterized protein n=1 Tax=Persea americana TaxID=3435 RepID=A0ACC2L6D4_PERAE|nr:hypothetical protein MRB53_022161 [Persea americana]
MTIPEDFELERLISDLESTARPAKIRSSCSDSGQTSPFQKQFPSSEENFRLRLRQQRFESPATSRPVNDENSAGFSAFASDVRSKIRSSRVRFLPDFAVSEAVSGVSKP